MMPSKDHMQQLKDKQKERFQPSEQNEFPLSEFGPPDFGDEDNEEKEFHFSNRDEIQDAYANFQESELEEPYPDDEDEEETYRPETNELDYGFTPPPRWEGTKESPEPESMKQPGGAFLRDEEIFPGGPTRSEVQSWKKQFEIDHHQVLLSEYSGEAFIWRTLSRVEYREVMAMQNTDPLQREEILCEICVLFPYQYNFSSMAVQKAGIPAVLAEDIMKASGFAKATPPIRL